MKCDHMPIEVELTGFDCQDEGATDIKKLRVEVFPLVGEELMKDLGWHLQECVRKYLEEKKIFAVEGEVIALHIPPKGEGNVH